MSNFPVSVSIPVTPKRRHFNQLDRLTLDGLSDVSEQPRGRVCCWSLSGQTQGPLVIFLILLFCFLFLLDIWHFQWSNQNAETLRSSGYCLSKGLNCKTQNSLLSPSGRHVWLQFTAFAGPLRHIYYCYYFFRQACINCAEILPTTARASWTVVYLELLIM